MGPQATAKSRVAIQLLSFTDYSALFFSGLPRFARNDEGGQAQGLLAGRFNKNLQGLLTRRFIKTCKACWPVASIKTRKACWPGAS